MAVQGAITLNSPAFWMAIVIALLLIALLTYIYSGKNIKQTLLFISVSTLAVGCAAVYDIWHYYLNWHFLAGIDPLGVPFRASRTGWWLLWDAWPLWSVPSFCLSAMVSFIAWWIIQQQTKKPPIIETHRLNDNSNRKTIGVSSEIVTAQLELDTLKRALAQSNQRLKQTLHDKELEAIERRQLQAKLQQYEQQQASYHLVSVDEQKALHLELTAKTEQLAQLTQQLMQQDDEIQRLQALIESWLQKQA